MKKTLLAAVMLLIVSARADDPSLIERLAETLEDTILLIPAEEKKHLSMAYLKEVEDREALIFAGVASIALSMVVCAIWGKLFSE